jgi:hypothetical protein
MDSYAVILCAALLRAGLFPALCTLGTLGTAVISEKSRRILVNFLGVISRLFPERTCAELLGDPSLIEFASSFASLKLSDRALKASQLLLSLSTAFSLARGRGGYTANSVIAKAPSSSDHTRADEPGNVLRDALSNGNLIRFPSATNLGEMFGPSVSSSSLNGSTSNVAALRIREHRITRAISDILDEIAHTSYARVTHNAASFSSLLNEAIQSSRMSRVSTDPLPRPSLAAYLGRGGDSAGDPGKASPPVPVLNLDLNAATPRAQTREDLMNEIKLVVTPLMDRNEFSRQVEASKVVGKEGKEPFKWDWSMIGDMLEYCIRFPERMTEAQKTKWVKRVSGFFRCSSDEKGYYSNLDW